ncbi:MAG TPA: NAD(P)/FAD-dependent oxidoreductase [Chryseosolibacter sp.]|nr:NAD(P)/FAD-dependent oxidoreductase [Chryseosolibacter sp.]
MSRDFDLIVIGGGAAGFYGAIQAAEVNSGVRVLILEKSTKLLSKVRVSGGGRCNVTHNCYDAVKLSRHYPRGERTLRTTFKKYGASDTIDWFKRRGVTINAEEDGRMFPSTNSSETIINCFLSEAKRLRIEIETGVEVDDVHRVGKQFAIKTASGKTYHCRRVLIAVGGSPKHEAYNFIRKLGHTVVPPIPSLFTFNDRERSFVDLMGISVPTAEVRITGTKFKMSGALLITHWGLSGPAVIKLSAWAAQYLYDVGYDFSVLVSWIGSVGEENIRALLHSQKSERAKQKVHSHPLFDLPQRLWTKLCTHAEIPEDKIWSEISNRHLNKLLEYIIKCPFHIKGKTTFKEEFVTCGGVHLDEVNPLTFESKIVNGVFFAGEVLNIDGETGGFNFQAAWSTAALAARSMFVNGDVA